MITIDELLADPPKLHRSGGELVNRWKLADEELRFIDTHIDHSSRTIETGAGCSTLVFAINGTQHTCIVPDPSEVSRILAYCSEKEVPDQDLRFLIGKSEKVLPCLDECNFDLALIDGRHGFPQPFLDWYYMASLLKQGGYVVIDDLHIWTCETLMRFLEAETDWSLVHESLSGAAFKKLGDSAAESEYVNQRFVATRSREFSLAAKSRYMVSLLQRGNFRLFMSTVRRGVRSACRGQFGKRARR